MVRDSDNNIEGFKRLLKIYISVETDFDTGNEISVFHSFSPSARRPRILAFRAF